LAPLPQADIRIVGLGPGPLEDLTLGVWQALITAQRVVVRTLRHPCVERLAEMIALQSCDDLYEQYEDFDEVYAEITKRIVALGREPGGVVFAVPGHPWVGEATTRLIRAAAQETGLIVHVSGGASFVEPSLAAVEVDLMDGAQVTDAMLLAAHHHPKVEVGLPLLVGQLYAQWLASDVKLTLMNAYPDEHAVTLIHAAGTPEQRLRTLPLHELDHEWDEGEEFDHLTSLYVPPLPPGSSMTDLQEIVAHLRAPEGCPWDQEQTLESLRQDLLSEVHEVLEAIDAEADGGDHSEQIAEELGDALLVMTMLVQIATEEGRFRMGDVTRHIVAKLVRRHPHVFGDREVEGVGEVLVNWDAIKAAEKAAKGQVEPGPLEGVPAQLPALEKARQLQSKAAKAGLLDRKTLARSKPALTRAVGAQPDAEAFGATLWALVALAHEYEINPEDALRSYAVEFRRQHR
jgi:tetrapyrrole methylase family protein/MazG family protein